MIIVDANKIDFIASTLRVFEMVAFVRIMDGIEAHQMGKMKERKND